MTDQDPDATEQAEAPADAEEDAGVEAPADKERDALTIDVTPALHMAGHEMEDLGFEGVPDTGPVLHDADDDAREGFEGHAGADIATRGLGH